MLRPDGDDAFPILFFLLNRTTQSTAIKEEQDKEDPAQIRLSGCHEEMRRGHCYEEDMLRHAVTWTDCWAVLMFVYDWQLMMNTMIVVEKKC
eukprot:scaffold5082_cov195-Ochromonas_danica.AAC.5